MKTIRILILEDDLKTVSVLAGRLSELETEFFKKGVAADIALTVLAEYTQVERYVNQLDKNYFDIILLDRDCKACGSFHVLDFEKFDLGKIISISSTPQWNEEARDRGVQRVVLKEFENLEEFADKVMDHVRIIIYPENEQDQ